MKTAKQLRGAGILLTILLTYSILACEGPAGPQGERGLQGEQGLAGPKGDEGNANVTGDTLTLTNEDYSNGWYAIQTGPNNATARAAKVAEIDIPEITQEIFESGLVLVYFKVPTTITINSTAWTLLPYRYPVGDNYRIAITNNYVVGTLRIYYFYEPIDSSNTPSISNITVPDYQFKYVIASSDAVQSMGEANIDLTDWELVENYLDEGGF